MSAYYELEFDAAIVAFKKVQQAIPADLAIQLYLERAARFLIEGVPEVWME